MWCELKKKKRDGERERRKKTKKHTRHLTNGRIKEKVRKLFEAEITKYEGRFFQPEGTAYTKQQKNVKAVGTTT